MNEIFMSYFENWKIIFKTIVHKIHCMSIFLSDRCHNFNFLSARAQSAKNSLRSALQADFQNFCAPALQPRALHFRARGRKTGVQVPTLYSRFWCFIDRSTSSPPPLRKILATPMLDTINDCTLVTIVGPTHNPPLAEEVVGRIGVGRYHSHLRY